ncbi:MAG: 30S ribosomal protein S20 [Candidatus Gastranaerophilales bacterium]|nr:30S ribosomal protein S20 [Candidatus Gastranaerophilales bacterium]
MANIKSSKKRAEISERNRLKNVSIKSAVKTAIRKVLEAVKAAKTEDITATLNKAYSVIDKAVSKGVLHKNTAARKKSRITRHLNKQQVPSE